MKKMMAAALVAASVLALTACNKKATSNTAANNASASATPAGTGIDGTWKADLSTVQVDAKPDQVLLKDGKFSCPTCTPPLTVAADGAFHPVTGRPYATNISVKVDDDHDVTQTRQMGGKETGQTKYKVSDDGKTLTIDFKDETGAKAVNGSLTETRVAAAPAGAHAISGSWKLAKYDNVSDEGTTVTYKLDGDTLHMSNPVGQSYDAKIGGPEVAVNGDIGKTMASVTKTGDNAWRETDKQDGKVVSTSDMTLDGDVLHVVSKNERDGSTTKFDMKRS